MKLNTTRGLASAVAAIGLGLVAPGVAAAHEGHPHGLDPGQTKSQLRGVDTTCDDEFRRIKGLGRACAVDDGLVKVELQDGSTVLTHAADDPKASGTSRMLGGTPRRPKCGTTRYFPRDHRAALRRHRRQDRREPPVRDRHGQRCVPRIGRRVGQSERRRPAVSL